MLRPILLSEYWKIGSIGEAVQSVWCKQSAVGQSAVDIQTSINNWQHWCAVHFAGSEFSSCYCYVSRAIGFVSVLQWELACPYPDRKGAACPHIHSLLNSGNSLMHCVLFSHPSCQHQKLWHLFALSNIMFIIALVYEIWFVSLVTKTCWHLITHSLKSYSCSSHSADIITVTSPAAKRYLHFIFYYKFICLIIIQLHTRQVIYVH